MNKFKYSQDNKRYHTLYFHNKAIFGRRIFKAALDGGFSCPNKGGCTYCISGGSEFSADSRLSVSEQIRFERERIHKKYKGADLIAYFQANTNTFAPLKKLKELYEEALACENVVGLSIATRADCIEDDVLEYLAELSRRTYLTVELGLQTIHDETAEKINRGHSFDCFLKTYKRLKEKNIRVCVHLIDGLPDETFDMMVETAKVVGTLKPDGVKIHLLHIMEGTVMHQQFLWGEVKEMAFDDYIKTVCTQLTYLPEETVIERITGDGSKDKLIAPLWSKDKIKVLGTIDKYMADNDLYQGIAFI